jgi:hypothetical protein
LGKQVARVLALPHELGPIRVADAYSGDATAISKPFHDFTFSQVLGAPQLDANTWMAFVFRCSERSLVYWDDNTGNETYTYNLIGPGVDQTAPSSTPSLVPVLNGTPYTPPDEELPMPFTYATPASTYAPHGPCLFAGSTLKGNPALRFFWLDQGTTDNPTTITFTSAGTAVLTSFAINAYMWTPTQVIAFGAELMVTDPWPIFQSGYYAFTYVCNSTSGGTLTIAAQITGSTGVWSHHATTNYYDSASAFQGVRIPAASILFTNTSSELNVNGQICGLQSPLGKDWQSYLNGSRSYGTLATAAQAREGKFQKGRYGFLKIQHPKDLDYQENIDCQNGVLWDSHYPLHSDDASFLVLAANGNLSASGNPIQTGRLIVTHHQEWHTTSQLFEQREGDYPPNAYEEGVMFLKHMEQWHENPLHWADIWNGIKNAGRSVLNGISSGVSKLYDSRQTIANVGNAFLGGLSTYGPKVAELAGTAALLI